jgi:YcxB-like protein
MTTSFSLRYRSTRAEVWDWYWRVWRHRLWRTHAAIFVVVVISTLVLTMSYSAPNWALAVGVGVVAVAWLPMVPLIAFKSTERTLQVDEHGISTVIGKQSRTYTWNEVATIEEHAGVVVISLKNLNALIIPRRAYASDEERARFLSTATAWSCMARATGTS